MPEEPPNWPSGGLLVLFVTVATLAIAVLVLLLILAVDLWSFWGHLHGAKGD
jgi:hypothetical protein